MTGTPVSPDISGRTGTLVTPGTPGRTATTGSVGPADGLPRARLADLPPGLIIAAPKSGAGKTTVTLGLLAAFRAAGISVQPFKCGPDYIDPAFHAAAAGRSSLNLDTWAMPAAMIARLITGAPPADLVLAEGAMGLFDGVAVPGAAGNGSAADLAALTGWPVVLVIDAAGQAQSAAAIAEGFAGFRADVTVAGAILNNVSSLRHADLLRAGFVRSSIPVLGTVRRQPQAALPERHLGLVQASEHADLADRMAGLSQIVGTAVDLPLLRALASAHRTPPSAGAELPAGHAVSAVPSSAGWPSPPGMRIAVATDDAFRFLYPHLRDHWHRSGCTILPFSPLDDQPPDPGADVCWLPGGYPELHAGRIAASGRFIAGLRAFAARRPVHGECGGYMVLGAGLTDADGRRHAMAGLLGLETSYQSRRLHLGYRLARLRAPIPGVAVGTRLAGHEFHYSSILTQPDLALADVVDANGVPVPETGSRRGQVTGSFFHLIAETA